MDEDSDLPPAFDADVVSRVADDHDVTATRLAELLRRHQSSVRELPGVANLVYEWRKQFDGAVLERTEGVYYVAAPPWVWEEFGESLDASDAEERALAAAHDAQADEQVGAAVVPDDAVAVVLHREDPVED